MYRINLYPEFRQKRVESRRRTIATAAFTVLAGLQLIVMGFSILNVIYANQQTETLSTEIGRLEQYLQQSSNTSPEIEVAQEMLEIKRNRVDWAPRLAELSSSVELPLYVVELDGRAEKHGMPAHLVISGGTNERSEQLERVSTLMSRLRSREFFARTFPSIEFGNVRNDRVGSFKLNCRSVGTY